MPTGERDPIAHISLRQILGGKDVIGTNGYPTDKWVKPTTSETSGSVWEAVNAGDSVQAINNSLKKLFPHRPSHEWNVSQGARIVQLRSDISIEADKLGANLDLISSGQEELYPGSQYNRLRGLLFELHDTALELSLRNWQLVSFGLKFIKAKQLLTEDDMADLWQVGFSRGLMYAAKCYDPNHSVQIHDWLQKAQLSDTEGVLDDMPQAGAFSTYAVPTTWGRMMRYRQEHLGSPIYVGPHGYRLYTLYKEMEQHLWTHMKKRPDHQLVSVATSLACDNGRKEGSSVPNAYRPSLQAVFDHADYLRQLSEDEGPKAERTKKRSFRKRLTQYRKLINAVETVSLDEPLQIMTQDPQGTGEIIIFEADRMEHVTAESDDPDKALNKQLLQESIQHVFQVLSDTEGEVLQRRFGLNGYEEHTLEEVADKMGLGSKEKVMSFEAKALRKLRHPTRNRNLRPYLHMD